VSASHAQYAHSTAQEPGVQATANKRQEQRTGAREGTGAKPSQAKTSQAQPSPAKRGGFWEREKEGTTASSHRDREQQRSKLTTSR